MVASLTATFAICGRRAAPFLNRMYGLFPAVLDVVLNDGVQALGTGADLHIDQVFVVVDGVGDLGLGAGQALLDGRLVLSTAGAQAAFQLLDVGRQHKDGGGAGVQALDVSGAYYLIYELQRNR